VQKLILILSAFILTQCTASKPNNNTPARNAENPHYGLYLTVNALPMWDAGFEGQGYTIMIAEPGIGTRDKNGNIFKAYRGRVLHENICDPSKPCFSHHNPEHATGSTQIAAFRSEEPGSDKQGIARSANIIAHAGGVMSALNDTIRLIETGDPLAKNLVAISLSLDLSSLPRWLCKNQDLINIISTLKKSGIAVITAHNGSANHKTLPECLPDIISVGATKFVDGQEVIDMRTSLTPELDLLAPGGPEGYLSIAVPHIAGAFALLRQANPQCMIDDILKALKNSGKPMAIMENGTAALYPKPRIDIYSAHQLLKYCTDRA